MQLTAQKYLLVLASLQLLETANALPKEGLGPFGGGHGPAVHPEPDSASQVSAAPTDIDGFPPKPPSGLHDVNVGAVKTANAEPSGVANARRKEPIGPKLPQVSPPTDCAGNNCEPNPDEISPKREPGPSQPNVPPAGQSSAAPSAQPARRGNGGSKPAGDPGDGQPPPPKAKGQNRPANPAANGPGGNPAPAPAAPPAPPSGGGQPRPPNAKGANRRSNAAQACRQDAKDSHSARAVAGPSLVSIPALPKAVSDPGVNVPFRREIPEAANPTFHGGGPDPVDASRLRSATIARNTAPPPASTFLHPPPVVPDNVAREVGPEVETGEGQTGSIQPAQSTLVTVLRR